MGFRKHPPPIPPGSHPTVSCLAAEGLRDSGTRLSDGRDQHPSSLAPPHTGLRPHDAMLDPRHRLSHPGAHERPSHERLSDGGRLSGPQPPHRQHSPNSPPNGLLGASPSFFPISEQEEDALRLSNLSTFSTGGMDIVALYAAGGAGGSGAPAPAAEGGPRDSLK